MVIHGAHPQKQPFQAMAPREPENGIDIRLCNRQYANMGRFRITKLTTCVFSQ